MQGPGNHFLSDELCHQSGGDFHQFRPVQERSILLPSTAFAWDQEKRFTVEQRREHDEAHALWKKFTTVVMLNEQVRAIGDPQLQLLLTRIRQGVQDQADVELLNSRCYQEGRQIPWESGITVVTPLNKNRWNLNLEATLAFQREQCTVLRIFISEHKWTDHEPTEEEALMHLSYGDDSAVPMAAIFMFVPGMPIVVNQNTHQGLKVVNSASYTALDVILDGVYPGYRVSDDTILHFGPPAGIVLASDHKRVAFRRHATRYRPSDALYHNDTLPAKATMARKGRQTYRITVRGCIRLYEL
jgi:hypothetical protein